MTGGASILVVEDNIMLRRMVCDFLTASGYTVLEAGDGGEAVKLTRQERPRLILMDIQLPTVSGLDATRAIRSDPEVAETPVIALTGFASPESERECRQAGCDDFMSKPYDMDMLLARIEGYLI